MPMLTDYETGKKTFVRKDWIQNARPMAATTTSEGVELRERTVITTKFDAFAVTETVEEIMADEVPPSSDYGFRK